MKPDLQWIVRFLERLAGEGSDEDTERLVSRLGAAIQQDYDYFLVNDPKRAEDWGETAAGLDAPRDVASYVLDRRLPDSLTKEGPGAPPSPELRQLVRELDELRFVALLGVYANRIDHHEGLRRAWDVLFNGRSPYLTMIKRFRGQSSGGRQRAAEMSKAARDRRIVVEATQLAREGMAKAKINRILAEKWKVGVHQIRKIRRKTDPTNPQVRRA